MLEFLRQVSKKPTRIYIISFFSIAVNTLVLSSCGNNNDTEIKNDLPPEAPWYGWNQYQIKPEDSLVRLGYDLIENTSYYFGPKGKIAAISNGMNCQNCHIAGGIIPWGNNFSAVIMSYPRVNYRSGKMMSISRRVNDCFERSLNGIAIDTTSHEMQAIIAYMHWIGDDIHITNDKKPLGSGIMQLPFLDRAADPAKGKIVYVLTCQRCHGTNGQGQPNRDGSAYMYPPLWGDNSYNTGAGLYRISGFAGFVKNNMPFPGITYDHPELTNEEAWDVAAYVNSQPRPLNKSKSDFPDISKKLIDDPSGPYTDTFSKEQHKFGPFKPIMDAMEKRKKE
ncbi:MAG: c-type cytochrome [Ginsengibacter sp.]